MSQLSPLQIKTGLRVAKPAEEVFDAIVNPEKMSHYFIAKGSGPLQEGTVVEWQFPEMDASFPISVKKVVRPSFVSYTWKDPEGVETLVEITLNRVDDRTTFVTITEGEKEATEEGIKWLKGNTEGWANFLACLKAYLEFGINLRKGAFDPSQMPA